MLTLYSNIGDRMTFYGVSDFKVVPETENLAEHFSFYYMDPAFNKAMRGTFLTQNFIGWGFEL